MEKYYIDISARMQPGFGPMNFQSKADYSTTDPARWFKSGKYLYLVFYINNCKIFVYDFN